jgi:hypothetical protein
LHGTMDLSEGEAEIEGKWPTVLSRRQQPLVERGRCRFMHQSLISRLQYAQSSQLVSVARPIDEH